MTQVHEESHTGENVLIALGSNATSQHGTPRQTVENGLIALDEGPLGVVAISRLYLTPFVPAGAGDDVVNAVAMVTSSLSPEALLDHLQSIEAAFDRVRGKRWGDRTLDLDIVAIGNRVLPDRDTLERWMTLPFDEQKQRTPDELIVPHPRLQERAFVLVPAADVAPGWVHPITGRTIAEMRDALPPEEVAAVSVLGE